MKRFLKLTYFGSLLALLLAIPTFAYLDPATLTYLVQIVVGFFIAGGVAVGVYWKKIKRFFQQKKKKKIAAQKAKARQAAAEQTVGAAVKDNGSANP